MKILVQRIKKMNYIKSNLTFIALIAASFVNVANASVIFFDDFDDGILMNNPLYASNNNGIIVSDPLEVDNALSFSSASSSPLNSVSMSSTTGLVYLSFDYLGTCDDLSGGCGGYLLPQGAGNSWLGTSSTANNWGYTLTDDNTWHHYQISYAATNFSFSVMDWNGVGNALGGDAFFDNIRISDTGFEAPPPAPIPEPMSLALFALGVFGLTARRFAK
jgi:hypothetical protein